ncbi:MAG: glycosyl hydrolase [Chloroflexi bacterium]|nr:glycosyl hydrolase [Chloroflexota bacterium]MBV9895379.1 glycosyl hydrolase [Chloroflexota bacterium]
MQLDFNSALRARLVGPHRGGRVTAVVGHPTNPQMFYFGHCAGGVWQTSDGGRFWTSISDGYFATGAVGALAISESDPNVLYAGMGETNIRGNVSHGDGVYRSTDGGRSWQNVGLRQTRHIARIRIDPRDPDIAYVAAFGHVYGPNPERGVYRTLDGGKNWDRILFRDDRTAAIDLSIDVTNPRILYAALWEGWRTPYSLSSGGPGSGLFRSSDGGNSWTELTRNQGLPPGLWGRPGVAVSPANPDRVWALVEAEADGSGLFRSDDRGQTWVRTTTETRISQRSWYFMHVFADPRDAQTVWCLNVQAWKSTDGGSLFEAIPTPFEDQHDLWIDPRDTRRVIEGNDGGACVSFNGGASWSSQYNQPTAQLYHVVTDDQVPYRMYGAQQDINTLSLPSRSSNAAITPADWYSVGGGESGYVAVRKADPNTVYAGSFGGHLTRYDHRTGQIQDISVWPDDPMGWGAGDLKYRFQWTFPLLASQHDADVLYACSQHVHRSRDRGMHWETISPDLTRADLATLEPSGGPIHKDNVSTEYYATVFALAESPLDPNVLWAGSDDGLVHVSRDAGATWQNATPPALPEWSLISIIDASPHHAATAYVAATRYKLDDFSPYLFRTTDFGATWAPITSGIRSDDFTRVIREDPAAPGVLFAGTETGLYVSTNSGDSWQPFQSGVPVTPIHDLVVKDGDLVLATHGRSFWIVDDITPLHEAVPDDAAAHLFAPRTAIRFRSFHGFSLPQARGKNSRLIGPLHITYAPGADGETLLDAGSNPVDGVPITYYLRESSQVSLDILDASGSVAATLQSLSGEPGVHRAVWGMRYPPPSSVAGATFWEDAGATGPLAPPGTYAVRLRVADEEYTRTFQLRADPRIEATDADLRQQFDLLLAIRDRLSQTHDTANRIAALREQLAAWRARPDAADLQDDVDSLDAMLSAVDAQLIQRAPGLTYAHPIQLNAKLAALAAVVGSADSAPTQSSREVFANLSARLDALLAQYHQIVSTSLAELNQSARALEVPILSINP